MSSIKRQPHASVFAAPPGGAKSERFGRGFPPALRLPKALIPALLLALSVQASAQESAAFLKIGVGARALGMGGAYTALADDASALYWNPAGLSDLSKRELGVMHADLVAQTRYDFLGYAHPAKRGTLGLGAVHLSQGALEGRDASGKPTGGFGASDTAINLAYAAKLASGLRFGVGFKYIQSEIADASAHTFALDAGGIYALGRYGPGVPILGFSVQNLGPGMKFLSERDALPLTFAGGVGYRLPLGLTLALDVKHRPHSGNSEVSVGTEYAVLSAFSLRAGYGSARALTGGASGPSAMSGFAAGFGFKAFGYSLDYSMTPFGELGNVQRFSLGARF